MPDDAPCTDCDGTGWTKQTERRCSCVPPQTNTANNSQATAMPDDAIERARQIMIEELRKAGCRAPLDPMIQPFLQAGVRAMLAFASQQAPEGWRPIDTAPKDGRMVDLWQGGERWPDSYWEGGMWWGGCLQNPTHWRPLPAPPAMLDAAPGVILGEVG